MNRDEKKYAKEFCANVSQWRRDVGLTQLALANLIGVSTSLVSAYERRAALPEYSMRQKINLALENQTFRRAKSLQKRIDRGLTDKTRGQPAAG